MMIKIKIQIQLFSVAGIEQGYYKVYSHCFSGVILFYYLTMIEQAKFSITEKTLCK